MSDVSMFLTLVVDIKCWWQRQWSFSSGSLGNLTVEFQNIHIQFDKSLVLFLLSICYMCNRIRFVAHSKCWCLLDSCSDLWFSIQPSVDRSMASGPVSSETSFTDVKSKNFSKTVIKNRLTASVRPESMSSPRSSLPYSEPSASQLVVV